MNCRKMLFLTLLASILPATLAVRCYICSWSPKDAANRTKVCNTEYFEANAVAISDCDNGCETFQHYDSNGVLEHIRRNCLQPETELMSECKVEETMAYTSLRCTCNYNLCNTATLLNICSNLLIFTVSLLFISASHHICNM